MSIAENRDEIIDLIKEDIAVVAGGYRASEIGDSFESLCDSFQALGICNLLLTAETGGLFRNLVSSGHTRRFFLRQAGDEPTDFHAISRTQAVFDLVGAGAMDLARELVALSPTSWIEDGEYEDDFAYFSVVHALVSGTADGPDGELTARLERLEACVTDETAPRLGVCRGLVTRDADTFRAAFEDLSSAHRARLEQIAPDLGDDPRFPARSAVFVEGLALLRLAGLAGVAPAEELALCPSSVLAARVEGRVEDLYEDVAAAMG